jgi:hypothetical protein
LLKNLTYKQKNKLLLFGAVLLLLLIYFLSIKKTMTTASACKEMENKIAEAQDMPVKVAELHKRIAYIDALLATRQDTTVKTQDLILSLVTNYNQTHGTVLKEFPKTNLAKENDFLIETNVFTAQGEFSNLLDLVYLIEQKQKIGKIASVDFLLKKDNQNHTTNLLATLFVQNIKKLSNEK